MTIDYISRKVTPNGFQIEISIDGTIYTETNHIKEDEEYTYKTTPSTLYFQLSKLFINLDRETICDFVDMVYECREVDELDNLQEELDDMDWKNRYSD